MHLDPVFPSSPSSPSIHPPGEGCRCIGLGWTGRGAIEKACYCGEGQKKTLANARRQVKLTTAVPSKRTW